MSDHPPPLPPVNAPLPTPSDLAADCGRCVGLCCVAPAFAAGADFAVDKAAGVPCPNLGDDHRCGIHDRLRAEGFTGCVAFDCFGAGQRVTQGTFEGRGWREAPARAEAMFGAFATVRQLHDLLWHLVEALALPATAPVHAELRRAAVRVDGLAAGSAGALARVDTAALRREVGPVLDRAAVLARAAGGALGPDLVGADLVGQDLRDRDLRGADLRAALLVGADLRGCDLGAASLLGADLRGADLRGARLAGVLFLSAPQVASARGDARTTLPAGRVAPAHWPT